MTQGPSTTSPAAAAAPPSPVAPRSAAWPLIRRVLVTGLRMGLTVLGLLIALFFLVRLSGDPAAVLAGPTATPDQIAAMRESLGLDDPLFNQFLLYLGDVARLDFGRSLFTDQPALSAVMQRLPATLVLTASTLAVTILVGVPTGLLMARGRRSVRSLAGGVVSVGLSVPAYILGVLLIWLVAVRWGWLPAYGSGSLRQLILPAITLAGLAAARTALLVGSELERVDDQPFLLTAAAKGASPRRILWRHALPNAMPAVVTMLVVEVSYLVSGAVVVEVLYAYSGIGKQLVDAIFARDYPLVQATVFVIGVLVVVVNILGDLLLARLDPRAERETA